MDSFLQDSVNATVTQLRRGRMMRLRQILSYAKLLTTAVDNYQEQILRNEPELEDMIYQYDALEVPAKLEYLMTLVRSFQDRKEKVVIRANFIGAIELIRASILAAGFKCKSSMATRQLLHLRFPKRIRERLFEMNLWTQIAD
ncbi:MAG: hypothetical protein IPI72_01390 [Flavobacteriales bacterium]|nr:hypothetical protein [Flavobacteriales bacterium]